MTIDTIRGSQGVIKELYSFHANVVTSCDMAIFLASGSGCYTVVQDSIDKIRDGVNKMRILLYAELLNLKEADFIMYALLYEAWIHHLDFHGDVLESLEIVVRYPGEKDPQCSYITGETENQEI